jgi:hypothetical protein
MTTCLAIWMVVPIALATGSAAAHVIMGTKSLHLRVVEADVIVRGRVVDPDGLFVSPGGRSQRQVIEIQILESLKGDAGAKRIRFAQDGHEVARYRTGQEALFFLDPITKSRELDSLAVPGGPTHVSGQEHDEQLLTEGATGAILLQATRDLVASDSAATADERVRLIQRATLDLLTSGDAALATAALASLVLTPDAALVTRADLPRLEKALADPTLSVGFRAGLIAELDRRGLVDGQERRLALLREATPAERPMAIRATATQASEGIKLYWLAQLADPDAGTEVKAECAIALGSSRDPRAVGALTSALSSDEPRVRNAAIRGLGRVGSPEARQAIEHAARTHPDPATRKRALAEARAREARSAR